MALFGVKHLKTPTHACQLNVIKNQACIPLQSILATPRLRTSF